MKVTLLSSVPVLLYTTCWYYTSSKNAVATQRLVQECSYEEQEVLASRTTATSSSGGGSSSTNGIHLVHFPEMMVLTALQLIIGLCISWPIYYYLLSLQVKVLRTSAGTSAGADAGTSAGHPSSSGTVLLPPLLSPVAWKTGTGMAVGILHFVGCLCTNMGFAVGSASVVQVIKLLEPIETMMLTALANVVILKMSASHNITVMKALSVLIIVTGTAMLLIQKSTSAGAANDAMDETTISSSSSSNNPVNYPSVFFALCSGFAMASRNVVKKVLLPKAAASIAAPFPHTRSIEENNTDQRPPGDPLLVGARHVAPVWIQSTLNGLSNYFSITAVAAVPATLCFLLSEIIGSGCPQINENNMMISTWMLQSKSAGSVGKEAIIFHGLYNLSSISVLGLISAQSHSILNVGKRIVNVLIASIAFQEPIGTFGILGLCIAAVGGMMYSSGSWNGKDNLFTVHRLQHFCMSSRNNKSSALVRRYLYLGMIGLIVAVQTLSLNLNKYQQYDVIESTVKDEVGVPHTTEAKMNQRVNRKYAVWMFPFPPPARTSNEIMALLAQESQGDENALTLICAYSNACDAFNDHVKINLPELTQGTYYHNYVRDHAYHKFRHLNDFPYHIQAITMLALLLKNSDRGENIIPFPITMY